MCVRAATKSKLKTNGRTAALKEQDELDKAVREFHEQQREIEAKTCEKKLDYCKALDEDLKQKRERDKAEEESRKIEEYKLKLFAEAKKVLFVSSI